MYPTKQHSTEEHAEAEEGWKLPTNGEYLRRRQAERFLGRSEWYLKLQELILPELRGVAMRGSAARWPTGEDAVATIELRKGEGVTLDMMDGLVQTPPRTVRHPRHPPLPASLRYPPMEHTFQLCGSLLSSLFCVPHQTRSRWRGRRSCPRRRW